MSSRPMTNSFKAHPFSLLKSRWLSRVFVYALTQGIALQALLPVATGQEPDQPSRIAELKAELADNPEFNLNAALLEATRQKQSVVVRWLLGQGASANASDFISGDSALHLAVIQEDLGTTLELLQRGGDVDFQNAEGKTPLDLATTETIRDVLGYFRDHPVPVPSPEDLAGGDPDSRSGTGTKDPPARPEEKTGSKDAEQTLRNSIGMQLQRIEAGSFRMGSKDSPDVLSRTYRVEPVYFESEFPAHEIKITRPFYLGTHEVTVGQFAEFVAATGHRTDAERNPNLGERISGEGAQFVRQRGGSWRLPGFEQQSSHPVVNVSWQDAQAFCQWLSRQEGRAYRLPTEAEWEYACRAGTTTRYSTGDRPESLQGSANVVDLTYKQRFTDSQNAMPFADGFIYTAPVGSYRPNAFGLHDMHGNVWEWCSDWFAPDYYRSGIGQDPSGPTRGERRSLRGGCWY